ncbi:hydantoinase B/oxoprolinase family protein [Roseomonas aerophila]|uniref:Hydantoinase B/oxoprolinase family protein n=1 Tax=Teichococcus aerophilus TaxID=1224513 RepID=A0ABR7RFA5_9PROT|nr:hydantoinase B/oxoprolinase family protein [Pseudoroseomonas aerophila]MBC9205251.1 hydantoinase B/oxoprolinase family protein [Pseudoroseomonas aerophila]
MRTNPVMLQVLRNHARAAAESMATTLYRTAHSTFVKETEDFTIQLLDAEGKSCAVPVDLGATWYPGLDYGRALPLVQGGYQPGDIAMTNDPYSGFLATHSPDIVMWKPVFHEGRIIAYAGGHIHNVDVGGAVPASLSRTLTEVHQEGIRIPPAKLYREGVLDEGLVRVMLANVRVPDQNWGDLKALVAAVNTGERRVLDLVRRFGVDTVVDGLADLLDYAEAQARAVLAGIPDGDYDFTEYADEDAAGGNPLRLCLRLSIRGDSADLDFAGTDPQTLSSLNVPTGGHPRHSLLLVGAYYVLSALHPGITLNFGTTRAFTCHVPEGSVLNPRFPAAVGMRSLTCGRLRSLIFGAFARAAPDRLPAAPAGATCIVNMAAENPRTGQRSISAIAPIVGGGGGMPHRDGTDGSGADAAYLKNSPIEITESEAPVRILRYGLMPDTGGPGAHRGGMAQVMEFRTTAPDAFVTARNRDRSLFQPWGIGGGQPGAAGSFTLNPGTAGEQDLGNTDALRLTAADTLRIVSPAGGGRGDPFTRDPAAVLRDHRAGLVSTAGAARDYGVAIVQDAVDEAATANLRAGRVAPPAFTPGAFRVAHEARWTPAAYAAMHEGLATLPPGWRPAMKATLFAAVRAAPEEAAEAVIRRILAGEQALAAE